jgi:hypothetical protein
MPQSKKLCFIITREGLGELTRPSALRKRRLMHMTEETVTQQMHGNHVVLPTLEIYIYEIFVNIGERF